MRIIPNPNNGDFVLDITSENPGKFIVKITDMTGRLLVERQVLNSGNTTHLDISIARAQDGVYLLRLLSEENLLVEKILVLK